MTDFKPHWLISPKRLRSLDIAESMVSRLFNSEHMEDLVQCFQECILNMGGSKFAFAQFRSWDHAPCFSVTHTYEEAWSDRYLSRSYHLYDPVFLSMKTLYQPLIWDFSKKRNLSQDQQNLFREASEFNLCSGMTFPVMDTSSGFRSFMTVVGTKKSTIHLRKVSELSLISRVFYERKTLLEKRKVLSKLSPREQQVLSLKSQGHLTKVVAGKLGISEATAVEYLYHAKLKLGCSSLDQALFRYGQLQGPFYS